IPVPIAAGASAVIARIAAITLASSIVFLLFVVVISVVIVVVVIVRVVDGRGGTLLLLLGMLPEASLRVEVNRDGEGRVGQKVILGTAAVVRCGRREYQGGARV